MFDLVNFIDFQKCIQNVMPAERTWLLLPLCLQDALIDMVRRSRVHFVHCLLPKAEAVGGGGEPRVTHGESPDSGLMTLDVGLLRAQLRGSKLLDALRIYRQGNEVQMETVAF